MKILVLNQPVNNRGDESAHKALIRSLVKSFPSANIDVLIVGEPEDSVRQFSVKDSNVNYSTILCYKLNSNLIYNKIYRGVMLHHCFSKWIKYCLLHDRFSWLKFNPWVHRIIRKIKSADIVINAPGGICMGGFKNWKHICYLEIAKNFKKEIYYYGRSFGPFREESVSDSVFNKISLNLLKYFTFLSIRDDKTEKMAKELGLSYVQTVDTAFLETPSCKIPDHISHEIGDNYIVFVPNFLKWHYAYRNIPISRIDRLYLTIIDVLHDYYPNYKIVMLPQTFNYNNDTMDDIHYFKYLKSKSVCSEEIIVVNDKYSSDIQQTIISNSKLLVGARYHSAVFAINNKIPFIALSYEHKISGMLATLGDLNNVIDIQDLSSDSYVDNYIKKFKEMLTNNNFNDLLVIRAKEISASCYHQCIKKILTSQSIDV